MTGRVDEARRALLDLQVATGALTKSTTVTTWVDTAFDGFLVFSKSTIESLGLIQEAATQAILADGNRVILESYGCRIEWFGESVD